MKYPVLLCLTLLLSLCLLCGCGESGPEPLAEGETYLEGMWYTEEMEPHVSYNLFSDGGGFLFVGETVIPIRYGISGEYIYISDNGNVESFPFRATEDGIWIDGMFYQPMEKDPEVSAAVESMRAEAERSTASSGNSSQGVEFIVQLVTLAAAVGVVVILVRFLRKRKKRS